MSDNVVYLKISSFAGLAPGASHYWGKLVCNSQRIELDHCLLAWQAREMNKRCQSTLFRAGNRSTTFFSEEEVIIEARSCWREKFPEAKVLVRGDNAIRDPQRVLVGPRGYQGPVNKLYREHLKLSWLCDEKRILEIEKEWDALNAKFGIKP